MFFCGISEEYVIQSGRFNSRAKRIARHVERLGYLFMQVWTSFQARRGHKQSCIENNTVTKSNAWVA